MKPVKTGREFGVQNRLCQLSFSLASIAATSDTLMSHVTEQVCEYTTNSVCACVYTRGHTYIYTHASINRLVFFRHLKCIA